MNEHHCVQWDQIPERASASGVTKRNIEGAGASLVMVTVPAGTKADPHSHSHEQFVQVVAGSGHLTTQQGERAFASGSVFHFPPNVWHSAVFDSDTVLIETNLRG